MIEISVRPDKADQLEILMALFTQLPVEGIREMEGEFLAYASADAFNSTEFNAQLDTYRAMVPFELTLSDLPDINWNEAWEKHFDPVIIEDYLTIKADFHELEPETKHVIRINPKMSFGTGHHATTHMMVKALSLLDVDGQSVLDAGTGTGILAILALLEGAGKVSAFDYDEWSFRNAAENFALNGMEGKVRLTEGSLDSVEDAEFDIVLANINRNYLVEHTVELAEKLAPGGILVISGFYEVDSCKLLDPFHHLNLVAQYLLRREDWVSIILYKIP